MDLDDIEREARAQREVSCEVAAGIHITLRIPTRHQINQAGLRAGVHRGEDGAALAVMQRTLLEGAVVAWNQALRIRHVLPGVAADDLLPYAPRAVPLVLDAQPVWADQLAVRLTQGIAERDQARDTASGN